MRKHQIRLRDRGDGVGWLRNEKRGGHRDCQRGKSHKDAHLQLLAYARRHFCLTFTPGRPGAKPNIKKLVNIRSSVGHVAVDLDQTKAFSSQNSAYLRAGSNPRSEQTGLSIFDHHLRC